MSPGTRGGCREGSGIPPPPRVPSHRAHQQSDNFSTNFPELSRRWQLSSQPANLTSIPKESGQRGEARRGGEERGGAGSSGESIVDFVHLVITFSLSGLKGRAFVSDEQRFDGVITSGWGGVGQAGAGDRE